MQNKHKTMQDNLCYQGGKKNIVKQQRNYKTKKQKYRRYKTLKTKMENKDIAKQKNKKHRLNK